jgi:hypothetical protein
MMILPSVEPMRLARLREPFTNPDWIFELKARASKLSPYWRKRSLNVEHR